MNFNGHAKIISKTFIYVLREAPDLHDEDGTVLWRTVMQKITKIVHIFLFNNCSIFRNAARPEQGMMSAGTNMRIQNHCMTEMWSHTSLAIINPDYLCMNEVPKNWTQHGPDCSGRLETRRGRQACSFSAADPWKF